MTSNDETSGKAWEAGQLFSEESLAAALNEAIDGLEIRELTPEELALPAAVNTHYYSGWETAQWVCNKCGWSGLGKAASEEMHCDDAYCPFIEIRCPECSHHMITVGDASPEQVRQAAARGHEGALRELASEEKRDVFLVRLKASQHADPSVWPELEGEVLDFQLSLGGPDENNDHWLLLTQLTEETREVDFELGDSRVIHAEIAAWENPEPAARIAGLLEQRYGSKFGSLNPWRATLYLCGDRWAYAKQIQEELKKYGARKG